MSESAQRQVALKVAKWLVTKGREDDAVAILAAWAARGENDAGGQELMAEALRVKAGSPLARLAFERMEGVPGDHTLLDAAISHWTWESVEALQKQMPKATFVRAQVGFNNNVKYKAATFHIQTEDSGLDKPHVITHLFADGGRIIKSHKRSYAEVVVRPDVAVYVRGLMKGQQMEMAIMLREGRFDEIIAGRALGGMETLLEAPRVEIKKLGNREAATEGVSFERAKAVMTVQSADAPAALAAPAAGLVAGTAAAIAASTAAAVAADRTLPAARPPSPTLGNDAIAAAVSGAASRAAAGAAAAAVVSTATATAQPPAAVPPPAPAAAPRSSPQPPPPSTTGARLQAPAPIITASGIELPIPSEPDAAPPSTEMVTSAGSPNFATSGSVSLTSGPLVATATGSHAAPSSSAGSASVARPKPSVPRVDAEGVPPSRSVPRPPASTSKVSAAAPAKLAVPQAASAGQAPPQMAMPYAAPFRMHVERTAGGDPLAYEPSGDLTVIGTRGTVRLPNERFCHPEEARLRWADDRLWLDDVAGGNGVFLRIQHLVELDPGDEFVAGDQLFRVDLNPDAYDDEPTAEPTYFYASPKPAQSLFRVTQLMEGGRLGACVLARNSSVQIGAEHSELLITRDPLVSPQHCIVEEQAGVLILTDLDSRTGVFVRIKGEQELMHGDEILIGRSRLRLEFLRRAQR